MLSVGGAPAGGSGGAGGSVAGAAGAAAHELAMGKPATASTVQPGNDPAKGNDHDSTTRWCASDATMPQWWRVDLGAVHQLQQVAIQFEHPERKYSYVIESSQDDQVYLPSKLRPAALARFQTLAFPPAANAGATCENHDHRWDARRGQRLAGIDLGLLLRALVDGHLNEQCQNWHWFARAAFVQSTR